MIGTPPARAGTPSHPAQRGRPSVTWFGHDRDMPSGTRASGLTAIELLIVLSVLAIGVIGAVVIRGGGSAHRDAASLARALTSARWLAVATGTPTTLVARDQAIYLGRGAPLNCDREPTGAPVWEPSRPVALRWPAMGLAFGAHGRPLRCDGSAVGNTTITLSGRDGSSAAVVIASLGRIRWERR